MEGAPGKDKQEAEGKEIAVDETTLAVLSKEEYITLAIENKKLAEEFLREDVERNKPSQLIEAVQAFGDALENAEKGYGAGEKETAEYFHRFGTTLMKLTSQKIEEAYKEKMLETMAAQEHGDAKKLSNKELEDEAAEFTDDFEEAWEALEMARMLHEKFGDSAGVATVRMSLGDACADVDQWEDAVKEYGEAARLYASIQPNSRRTVEALFLHGLSLQMTGSKNECRNAMSSAHDTMVQVIAALPESEDAERKELETILAELKEKVQQVSTEEFWELRNAEEKIKAQLDNEEDGDEELGEGQEREDAAEVRKRLIDDTPIPELEGEAEAAAVAAEAPKRQKTDPNENA